MNTFRLTLICCLLIAAGNTLAESYQIQVRFTVRLRASYSLDSPVVGNALAGDVLQVVGRHNRWLKIERDGESAWLADWVDYTRLDQQPAQPATAPAAKGQTPTNVDNCCFVDRQCSTDQEWREGFWAYQRNECPSSAPSTTSPVAQPPMQTPDNVDNCCFVNRQCSTDQEWKEGFWAYQNYRCNAPAQSQSGGGNNCCSTGWNCADDWDWNNGRWAYANNVCVHPSPHDARPDEGPNCCHHGWNCTFDFDWLAGRFRINDFGVQACGSPLQENVDGVIIEGSARFIARVKEAFALIKRRSPAWHAYSITAARKIREALSSGTLQRSWNLTIHHTDDLRWLASVIVHESCHQQRWLVWVWHDFETEWLAEEAVCDTVAINAARQIVPGFSYPRDRINDFLALGIPFDVDASANREWQRANLILSRMN